MPQSLGLVFGMDVDKSASTLIFDKNETDNSFMTLLQLMEMPQTKILTCQPPSNPAVIPDIIR